MDVTFLFGVQQSQGRIPPTVFSEGHGVGGLSAQAEEIRAVTGKQNAHQEGSATPRHAGKL
jgi:hypothetical protein